MSSPSKSPKQSAKQPVKQSPKQVTTESKEVFTIPEMRQVKILMTDDTEFYVKMAVPSDKHTIRLAICPKSHHAWQGFKGKVSATQVQKFRNKFGIKPPQ